MTQLSAFDVVVYGGTPGGIAAALRCAREGMGVALINAHQHLGGMLTSGLGLYDTSYFGKRAPLVEEIFAGILAHYKELYGADSENVRLCEQHRTFEPHVAERVLTRLVEQEKNITALKGWWIDRVERDGRLIHALGLRENGGARRMRIEGQIFVDASYEADLAACAGAPYRVGRESRAEFGEPHAGKIFSRYDEQSDEAKKFPYAGANGYIKLRPFDLCTGRIFPGSTGEGDRAIMAYNFRLSLSRDPANHAPIPKPANYARETYLGLLQDEKTSLGIPYPVKSKWLVDDIRSFKFRNHRPIPNSKLSWNHGNFTGRNHRYPDADWEERNEILAAHRDHEMGLLWFLQNDEEVPAEVRARARELGLARDEFADNGHIPWEIYVREARRIKGRAVFTELDASLASGISRTPPHADSIAISEWMMDSHECTTERQPGSMYEGAVLLSELTRPAQVPYRCLLPHGIDNLLVPVCLSATHIGWGTIRVEPTWIHIAESAAFACVLALRTKQAPAAIDVQQLQHLLVARGLMISFFNDFDMATPAAWVPAVQFFGSKGFFATYDARPNDLLDRETARRWIEGLCSLALGKLSPLPLAQAIARVQVAEAVPAREFAALVAQQVAFVLDTTKHQAVVQDWPGAKTDDPVTRGDACAFLYSVCQRLTSSALPQPVERRQQQASE